MREGDIREAKAEKDIGLQLKALEEVSIYQSRGRGIYRALVYRKGQRYLMAYCCIQANAVRVMPWYM